LAHIWTPENGFPLYETVPEAVPVGLLVVVPVPGVVVVPVPDVVVVLMVVVGLVRIEVLLVVGLVDDVVVTWLPGRHWE
jgi:hypothetical protein